MTRTSIITAAALFLIVAALALTAQAGHEHEDGKAADGRSSLILPMMNPLRGKKLFVSKGCVTCHAVNGVGGHDAPPMDAHAEMKFVNPFDFAAKMWNHAPGMLAAQEEAFGETVTFLGHELADIIAFVHDDEAQHSFQESDITPKIRAMMDHKHGEAGGGPQEHKEEIGHGHAPGTPAHAD